MSAFACLLSSSSSCPLCFLRVAPPIEHLLRLVQYGTCRFYCAGGGTWGALNLTDGFAIW